jgi:hypothetical protein
MKPVSMASSAPPMLVMAYGMKKGVIFLWPCTREKQGA